MNKAPCPFGTSVRPFDISFGRTIREHEPAGGIGPIMGDDIIGIDDIVL